MTLHASTRLISSSRCSNYCSRCGTLGYMLCTGDSGARVVLGFTPLSQGWT